MGSSSSALGVEDVVFLAGLAAGVVVLGVWAMRWFGDDDALDALVWVMPPRERAHEHATRFAKHAQYLESTAKRPPHDTSGTSGAGTSIWQDYEAAWNAMGTL